MYSNDPLIYKSRERQTPWLLIVCCTFFCSVVLITVYSQLKHKGLLELSLGAIEENSWVRLAESHSTPVVRWSAGVEGQVVRMSNNGMFADVRRSNGQTLLCPIHILVEIEPPMNPPQSSDQAGPAFLPHWALIGPPALPPQPPQIGIVPSTQLNWEYWNEIRRDPWYTERTCNGGVNYCNGDHRCTEAYVMFHTRLIHKHAETHGHFSKSFTTKLTSPIHLTADQIQSDFLRYMNLILTSPDAKLILISVFPGHTFVIEQSKRSQFRIYQSWAHAFDLKYWTNHDQTPMQGEICEPGSRIIEQLENPHLSEELTNKGIGDDSLQIFQARMTYGGLRSVSKYSLIDLLRRIAHGFHLQQQIILHGEVSIFPAPNTIDGNYDTKPYLGKNVIDLKGLSQARTFSIEVSILQQATNSFTQLKELFSVSYSNRIPSPLSGDAVRNRQ